MTLQWDDKVNDQLADLVATHGLTEVLTEIQNTCLTFAQINRESKETVRFWERRAKVLQNLIHLLDE